MNTQTPSIHPRLWHRDFWLMATAQFLLSASVTMLIPSLPGYMQFVAGLTSEETGLAMGAFALGLFLPGGFCSFLVQRYRRNMVCIWSMAVLGVAIIAPNYLDTLSPTAFICLRLLQGAAYGLAQMVLESTLIIDTSESSQRTEANHSSTWFGRFALSLGPLAALIIQPISGFSMVINVAAALLAGAAVLVLSVHVPFRVPADKFSLWSFDRFLYLQGWPLFLNLLLVTVAVGLLLSLHLDIVFYGLMMIGFLLALLAQRFVFRDADLKSEIVSGLLLICAAVLILFTPESTSLHSPLCSPLLGLGLGLTGSRFLLFFIKLSRHCKRGTSQSSFILAWESGLALGLGLGFYVFADNRTGLLFCALALLVLALLLYTTWIHPWFISHKNR